MTRRRARVVDALASLTAFGWPFLFLFPYVFPADGSFLVVGNDFHILYYNYKTQLLDSLSRFDIPWWSPSEAAGFPFYASPFSETFYPLNIALALFYRLAGGWEPLDHQRYAVLGIAIFSLGLFRWLRALNFSTRVALCASMVMGVSFKLTELMRFPNAIHTAAWYPWVLLCLTRIVESTSTTARIKYSLLLTTALTCLLTGGYPYYVFYSPFLFGPYLAILLLPRWSRALVGREPANVRDALTALAGAGALTMAIAGTYLYKTSLLMQQTTDRAGKDFDYSTAHIFGPTDSIGAWIFPPATQIEGWYYFGMVNVLVILLYAIHRRPLAIVLLTWILVITYITYGRWSYLFILLWQYVPMFSSLRVWSRMNIILVPLIAWLLAAAYVHLESLLEPAPAPRRWGIPNVRPLAVLSAGFAVLLALQFYASSHWQDAYWKTYYAGGTVQNGVLTALGIYLRGLMNATRVTLPQLFIISAVVGCVVAGVLLVLPPTQRVTLSRGRAGALAGLVALAGLGLWLAQPWAHVGRVLNETTVTRPELVAYAERSFIVFGVIAFVALVIILMQLPKLRTGSRIRGGALAGVMALAALDLWAVGPWAWAYAVWEATPRRPFQIAQQNLNSFGVPRSEAPGVLLGGPFTVGVMPNWYFERYNAFLRRGQREPDALKQLLGVVDGRKLWFSGTINHASIQAFLDDARRFTNVERVVSYTGDELAVIVRAPAEGYLSFIDNWDPDWEASVDGTPVRIDLLFGTFKSVRLLPGEHVVRFEYRPFRLSRRPES